jgi:hypothetical protein
MMRAAHFASPFTWKGGRWVMAAPAVAIDRAEFDIGQLMATHPPVWHDANKRAVFEIARAGRAPSAGTLSYSRWRTMALPQRVDPMAALERVDLRVGFYDYEPSSPVPGLVEWHVNFADPILFVAYRSSLFAQDEMQVVEHPVLGALREALDRRQTPAVTVDRGRPTPVLVTGAERWCRVETDRNAAQGRAHGLYGTAFSGADEQAVRRATTRIEPATITNLIAMAAPAYGYGAYSVDQLEFALTTAFTGFGAAVHESVRLRGTAGPRIVHTGFWGCGAFGGNRVLMTALQIIAAEMAGLNRIVFHTADAGRLQAVDEARAVLARIGEDGPIDTPAFIFSVAALGLEWGVSDGN